MDKNTEIIKEIFADKTFIDQLIESENIEDAHRLMANKGITYTLEETKIFMESLAKELDSPEEFSEEDLEAVAGGVVVTTAVLVAAAKVAGVSLASFLAAYYATKSVSKALHRFGC